VVKGRGHEPPRATQIARSGVLVERAAAMLAAGPKSTADLAAEVLGLRGNESAAAAAVWTLLSDDPRFVGEGTGVWSLRANHPSAPTSLLDEDWVVVDVETTGGTPATGHRVTEVAAVCVSGGAVVDVFSSLVNPGRPIPSMITRLTGITDAMVRDAPPFRDVAARLCEVLDGRVFVAHNAPFDWRFVCAELEAGGGVALRGRKLCTVRLARKLLPQLPSRSLDALVEYFDLRMEARHRAEDDARATAQLLLRLIGILEDRGVTDWPGLEVVLGQRSARRPRSRQRQPRSMDAA
jgi:DNA polymerase III subunit epsilon